MDKEIIQRISALYSLEVKSILNPQRGYRNESRPIVLSDNQKVNLIIYKEEPGILRKILNANRLSAFVAESGLPARKNADHRIVQLRAGVRIRYGSLYNYLPGSTIPWESYTKEHIKNLGKMHAKLHEVINKFSKADFDDVHTEYLPLCTKMADYFGNDQVKKAIIAKLALTIPQNIFLHSQKLLQYCQTLPNQQLLHMDFVRGNILFNDAAEITGILDFEKTGIGHPIMDIARTLAFLLVDCKHKDEEKIKKYYLISGYIKRGGGQRTVLGKANLLEELVNFFLLYDFYKFLLHNPYEYLQQNEHFVRTRNLLVKRGLILGIGGKMLINET
jgi:thiamine kinase-like enzyme